MAFRGPKLNAILATTAFIGALVCGSIAEAKTVCSRGSDGCAITLKLRPSCRRITVHGELTREHNRYSYAFKAQAGQKLTWTFNGPTVRTMIRYPTGETEGPGLPNDISLTRTGTYTFTVNSNTMAEGIFGSFDLTLQLQ
jgi:hypothetical protein